MVVITGANLGSVTSVLFGSTISPSFTVNSPSSISAVTPAGQTGKVNVVLTSPYGNATVYAGFEYLGPPAISSVSPNLGPESGGTLITIVGTGLSTVSEVLIAGVPANSLNIIDSTSITVLTPGGPRGLQDVAVTNQYGTTVVPDGFEYKAASGSSSIWSGSEVPAIVSASDSAAVELGVKFRSSVAGYITGVKFYKGATNTGTHTGSLWSSSGTRLATVTFGNETASGWQYQAFAAPWAISAGTTYVVSYHAPVGRYALNQGYFSTSGVDSYPLRALANGEDGSNGVYRYGASGFPNQSWNASNYWVDVVFTTSLAPDTTPPTVASVTPALGASNVSTGTTVTATFSEAMNAASINAGSFELRDASNAVVSAAVTYDAGTKTAVLDPGVDLAAGVTYTARLKGGSGGVADAAGNVLASDFSWSFTTQSVSASTYSIWANTVVPSQPAISDGQAIEIGVKFRSSSPGYITGLRFYKGAANTGTHVGHLWTARGTQLASATFTNETASGWQEVLFAAPVAIAANTTYVVSYHSSSGYFVFNPGYFTRRWQRAFAGAGQRGRRDQRGLQVRDKRVPRQ